jgi:transcriptional regulator with XRE-family HTH domain
LAVPLHDEDDVEARHLLVAFGADIRAARHARNLSQEQLAGLVGIGQQYLSRIEHGERRPALALMIRIARQVGLRVFLTTGRRR